MKAIFLLFCLLFFFAACGRNMQPENYTDDSPVHTLTVLAPFAFFCCVHCNWGVLNYAGYRMAEEWAERGEYFSIDITTYHPAHRESVLARLQVEIMAGTVPDIIILDHAPWTDRRSLRNFLSSGAFADFYSIIDNCPDTSRDDFFTNVLEAWEINGRLHAMPVAFGFDYVGINANMPQSVLDKFSAFDTISMHELLRLYLYMREAYYGEFDELTIFINDRWYSPFHILSHSMNGFVDFSNNVSSLDSVEFVGLLEDWWQVFNGQSLFDFESVGMRNIRHLTNILNLRLHAARYVFSLQKFGYEPVNALIPNSNPYFVYYIPITDEQGRLRVSNTRFWSSSYGQLDTLVEGSGHMFVPLISAAADEAVAWEYVQRLITAITPTRPIPTYFTPPRRNVESFTLITPIRRDYFEHYIENILRFATHYSFFWCTRRPQEARMERERGFETTIARMAAYNEMPITPPFMIPGSLFADLLDTFLRSPPGFFGAEQTAQELHNRVSLWLIE